MSQKQDKKSMFSGFTLVEIMIVIVIITILFQLGNISGLFKTRERGHIEEITASMVGYLEEEKTNALLGKMHEGNIVRKRIITITTNPDEITIKTEVNLAKDNESSVLQQHEKSWKMNRLNTKWYSCPGETQISGITEWKTYFTQTEILFGAPHEGEKHIILQLEKDGLFREVHLDRRTGLTFERIAQDTVSCD